VPGKKSFVCDVNGWSFVKNSRKYYDDCSQVLCETMLLALRPEYHSTLSTVHPLTRRSISITQQAILPQNSTGEDEEELLCVISVIRHGDRTPKQKMKVKLTDSRYLHYYHSNTKSAHENLKVKSAQALTEFLDLTVSVTREGPSNCGGDAEYFNKLLRIKEVLESHKISGINRKLQMKPERWVDVLQSDGSTIPRASQVLFILKWGGDLTPLGEQQAAELGADFRTAMYPDPSGGGVLRLHSTFRHDLKIKASDEGRVMKTAAAFTKGMLELEGDLTPLLVSLVTVQEKSNQMLDHYDNIEVKNAVDKCKAYLTRVLQMDTTFTPEIVQSVAPVGTSFLREALLKLGNPRQALRQIHELINRLCSQISSFCESAELKLTLPELYLSESYELLLDRWEKLNKDFFSVQKQSYDLTKVPEVYDMARYDVLHNSHIGESILPELFGIVQLFADCVVPQEYGIDDADKRFIGSKMCYALLRKIQYDLNIAKSGTQMDMQYLLDLSHGDDLRIRTLGRCVRTRLYFTSESHLYTLLYVLNGSPRPPEFASAFSAQGRELIDNLSELSYLSHISIRLFDNRVAEPDSKNKYRCEISFSPGVSGDPRVDKSGTIAQSVILNRSISCDDLVAFLGTALADVEGRSATPDKLMMDVSEMNHF
jgi:inositol-hexakisphosphate/diphosphoinositol-pentakisphosphate 1-kinase